MYNAVGIDVSKGKSTVAVLQPGGTIVRKPFDVILQKRFPFCHAHESMPPICSDSLKILPYYSRNLYRCLALA